MEFETGNLKSATLNGSDVRHLFSANMTYAFYSLDVYGDHLYLCYNRQIVRIHKRLEEESTVLYHASDEFKVLYALRIYQQKGKTFKYSMSTRIFLYTTACFYGLPN